MGCLGLATDLLRGQADLRLQRPFGTNHPNYAGLHETGFTAAAKSTFL
jgi:hypothetical protein